MNHTVEEDEVSASVDHAKTPPYFGSVFVYFAFLLPNSFPMIPVNSV